jgi:hypothetical protein
MGNVHKTGESKNFCKKGFEWKEYVGSSPNVSIPKMLGFEKKLKGEWTYEDLGKHFWLIESKDIIYFMVDMQLEVTSSLIFINEPINRALVRLAIVLFFSISQVPKA